SSGADPAWQPAGANAQPKASVRDALIVDQAMAWYLPRRTTSMPRVASRASPTTASTRACPEDVLLLARSVHMGLSLQALDQRRRGEPRLPVGVVEARVLLPRGRGRRTDEVHAGRGHRPQSATGMRAGRPQPAGGTLQCGIAEEARGVRPREHGDARLRIPLRGEVLVGELAHRSEERRVGKGSRSGWGPEGRYRERLEMG